MRHPWMTRVLPMTWLLAATATFTAPAAEVADVMRATVQEAVAQVKPALVRIHVVYTSYNDGRELKHESMGSGVVIDPRGYVITNHHVAGHATRITCIFADKREVDADLAGTDPLTDIAVLKLEPDTPGETFPVAPFGDSDALHVGQHVLAMGSPMALSQSVTLGIISNTEMIMPEWMGSWGAVEMDGEDVGALVRWIAHDAEIHGGNSGGPLVDLEGRVVGINEIRMGLGGAIPGNLAKDVALALIEHGAVRRAWIGLEVQPLLKEQHELDGALVCGTVADSPAEAAGFESGDILLEVAGAPVSVRFAEQLPLLNQRVADLPIGEPSTFQVRRGDAPLSLEVTPIEREPALPKTHEIKEWGLTVRNLSLMDAKELKRDSKDGVLVTSVRPGGPAGDAKPRVNPRDIILSAAGEPIENVAGLRAFTQSLPRDQGEQVPVLTTIERKTAQLVTVVEVGIPELPDPPREVKKAWLPVETQVITRDIASALGDSDLTGFRVIRVYEKSTAQEAGVEVGDLILAVDGEKMTASQPEHYEELEAWIREYRETDTVELRLRRGEEELTLPVQLVRAPEADREMKKWRDENFEFTVRNTSFFDKAKEKWERGKRGVLVDDVKPGGWAAVGRVNVGDLIQQVNGRATDDVDAFEAVMKDVVEAKPDYVVLRVVRGIHTLYLELEPKWNDNASEAGKE